MTEAPVKNHEVPVFSALVLVLVSFMLVVFLGTFSVLLGYSPVAVSVLAELLLAVVPLAYMLYKHVDIKKYVGFKVRLRFVILGIALGFLLILLNSVVSATLVMILGESQAVEESNRQIMNAIGTTDGLLLVILALSLAGICEEFLFRGFLQSAIANRYSSVVAVILSSLAFSLFHFDLQLVYIAFAFIIGLMFGLIYNRWRSYIVCAVAHATMNLIVLASMILVQ
jgi:membrane protease YdiL (CAAX protease family)